MPKEVIAWPHSEESNSWNELGEVTGKVMITSPRLTLHWSTLSSSDMELSGGVSLSILPYPPVSKEDYDQATCWPPPPETPQDELYTANLERDQLNRLIRLLRKARDAAYGRDE
jgi:hypothetical protein